MSKIPIICRKGIKNKNILKFFGQSTVQETDLCKRNAKLNAEKQTERFFSAFCTYILKVSNGQEIFALKYSQNFKGYQNARKTKYTFIYLPCGILTTNSRDIQGVLQPD